MNIEKLTKLRQQVDKLQRESDQATGALTQLKKQLKKDYQCSTTKEAKELLAKLEREQAPAEKEFEKALTAFEKQYGDLLDE